MRLGRSTRYLARLVATTDNGSGFVDGLVTYALTCRVCRDAESVVDDCRTVR